ncbi:hypothetical protein J3Q64DRAFT_1386534 [Phycomyces blakesleeanus]|uniref:Plasma membrane fusion protein PRM1 n=2 Tax=Phycomyces blakesleeanus TaxID=4837 RepID=A0A162WCN6_PHYB8|nr:hypothetical protein PHYBLDRAFT_175308 [Phycomyces blakesleeanus NRRL 1555(-)]OAD66255.1 hypothetical protein PHYBLDRAFT_175308 [Phycomyces blakesleeanus NRRL 1555(-)]|eukprot:XP_018284295.1 hypothetical protein PHYBLDRAFT_175308 [Phycomyces blakesleeanus NRRL 1555(-)]
MSLNYPFPRLMEEYCFVWLSGGTLILLSVLMPVLQFHSVVRSSIQGIQSDIDETCQDINNAVFHLRDLPNTLSWHVLKSAATSVDNLQRVLITLLSVIQSCVVWLIGVYKSTYRCLLGLAINTILSVATTLTEPIQKVATTVLDGIAQGVHAITDPLAALTGTKPDPPANQFQMSNWTKTMDDIRSKVYNWTEGPDIIDTLVGAPFEAIKSHININNNSFSDWILTHPPLQTSNINHNPNFITNKDNTNSSSSISNSALTIYQYQQQEQECDPTKLKHIVQDLDDQISSIIWTAVGLIVLAMALCTVWVAIYRYLCHNYLEDRRSLKITAGLDHPSVSHSTTNTTSTTTNGPGALHLLAQEHRYPGVSIIINHIKHKSNFSQGRLDALEWWITLLSNPFTLYCLLLGTCGLLTTYALLWTLQSLMAKAIREFDAQAVEWARDTTADVLQSLSRSNTADLVELNGWISQTEAMINDQAFGFIRSVSLSLNTTLSGVVGHLTTFVQTVLGGTILEEPAKGVLGCLVLVKLENVEQGLTWIVDNVHINLTRINPNILDLVPVSDVVAQVASLVPTSDNPKFGSMLASLDLSIEAQLNKHLQFYWVLIYVWLMCLAIGFGLFSFRYWVEKPVSKPINYIQAYNESYNDSLRDDYTIKHRY